MVLADALTYGQEIGLVALGAGISLATTFLVWLAKFLIAKIRKVEKWVLVKEINENILVLKFKFINKSTEAKLIKTVKVYFDDGGKQLIPCEDNVTVYEGMLPVHHDSDGNDTSFTFMVPPKSVEEHSFKFDAVTKLDLRQQYFVFFGTNKESYLINLKNKRWQKLSKKNRFKEDK